MKFFEYGKSIRTSRQNYEELSFIAISCQILKAMNRLPGLISRVCSSRQKKRKISLERQSANTYFITGRMVGYSLVDFMHRGK